MRKPEMTKQSIEKIFAPMVDLLVKKNHDYKGASFDLGLDGNFVHIWDKVSRMRRLIDLRKKGESQNFEGLVDTYHDLIGYCVIGLHILQAEERDETNLQSREEYIAEYIRTFPEEEKKDVEDALRNALDWADSNFK